MDWLRRRARFVGDCILWLAGLTLLFLFIKFALPLFSPFLFGFLLAFLAARPARWLAAHTRLRQNALQIGVVAGVYLALGAAVYFGGAWLVVWAGDFFSHLPDLYDRLVRPVLDQIQAGVASMSGAFHGQAAAEIGALLQSVGDCISGWLSAASRWALGCVGRLAASLPGAFVWCATAVLSSLFFAWDYPLVTGVIARCTPRSLRQTAYQVKDCLQRSVWCICKSYLILMAITFGELLVGLWLLRIPHPFSLALLIALVDLLPVLGTGAVMIPWGAFLLLSKNYTLGISILLLYVVISVLRSILEPRILGGQTGLHPIVTLMGIYVGGKLLGFAGILLVPLLLTVVYELYRCGILKGPGGQKGGCATPKGPL